MSERPPRKKPIASYLPPEYDVADVAAFQALHEGEATPEQQKRALDWLITKCAGVYEFHYYPNDRDTSFALGRAFVGQQVVKLLHLNKSRLMQRERNG